MGGGKGTPARGRRRPARWSGGLENDKERKKKAVVEKTAFTTCVEIPPVSLPLTTLSTVITD